MKYKQGDCVDFSNCTPVWERHTATMTVSEYDLLKEYINAADFTQRLFRDMFSRCAAKKVQTDKRLHTRSLDITELEQMALDCIRGTTDSGRLFMWYILAPTREQIKKYSGRWTFPTIAELEEDEQRRNERTVEDVTIRNVADAAYGSVARVEDWQGNRRLHGIVCVVNQHGNKGNGGTIKKDLFHTSVKVVAKVGTFNTAREVLIHGGNAAI